MCVNHQPIVSDEASGILNVPDDVWKLWCPEELVHVAANSQIKNDQATPCCLVSNTVDCGYLASGPIVAYCHQRESLKIAGCY